MYCIKCVISETAFKYRNGNTYRRGTANIAGNKYCVKYVYDYIFVNFYYLEFYFSICRLKKKNLVDSQRVQKKGV